MLVNAKYIFVPFNIGACFTFKPLFHSSHKPTSKLAASTFKYCDWMKVLGFAISGKEPLESWWGAIAIAWAEHEYMNIHTPPPFSINALVSPLLITPTF